MKVLIIDDEQGILSMYEQYLKSVGIETMTTGSGKTGLEVAKAQKPDIILLDIIMPQLNGLDVLKTMKEDSEIKNIPVYLLTNLPEECSGEKAKELGAAGYLVKAEYEPKMLAEFLQKIRQNNPANNPTAPSA